MQAAALLIFDGDVRTRSWWDWLSSHTSFSKPLHRYNGVIYLRNKGLYFEEFYKRAGNAVDIIIEKHNITSVYHGYDNIYAVSQVRGLGLT